MERRDKIHKAARALHEFVRTVYPELHPDDVVAIMARTIKLLQTDAAADYRREDLVLMFDQAYAERTGKPHKLNPNWFTLTGMLRDNHKDDTEEE